MQTKTLTRPWTCDACGLTHSHYRHVRHNLGPFVRGANLEYDPTCHCGWHEVLARIEAGDMMVKPYMEELIRTAVKELPIPTSTEKDIERKW